MKLIFSFSALAAKFPIKAGYFLLLCTLACVSSLNWASAQDKQQEGGKSVITLGEGYSDWGEGPDYRYSRSMVTAPDGSSLMIYDYSYKSGKSFRAGLKDCAKGASRVADDSTLLDARGRKVGRRVLIIIRDSDGRDSTVLCRSETSKRSLTMIYGKTLEHVLGFERSGYPK